MSKVINYSWEKIKKNTKHEELSNMMRFVNYTQEHLANRNKSCTFAQKVPSWANNYIQRHVHLFNNNILPN